MGPQYSVQIPRVRTYFGFCLSNFNFTYKTLTSFGYTSHCIRLSPFVLYAVLNPENISILSLASSAFARHYSRNLVWFLFLSLLRCFSSGGSPYIPMYSVCNHHASHDGVSPFGYLRIYAYLQLPAAFRSLSRPSSASNAKAFTLCSSSLELHELRKSFFVRSVFFSAFLHRLQSFLIATLLRCSCYPLCFHKFL